MSWCSATRTDSRQNRANTDIRGKSINTGCHRQQGQHESPCSPCKAHLYAVFSSAYLTMDRAVWAIFVMEVEQRPHRTALLLWWWMDSQGCLFGQCRKKKKKENARNERLYEDGRGAEWQKGAGLMVKRRPYCGNMLQKWSKMWLLMASQVAWIHDQTGHLMTEIRSWIIKPQAMAVWIKWVLHSQPLFICQLESTCRPATWLFIRLSLEF